MNPRLLAAMLAAWGAEPVDLGIATDTPAALATRLEAARGLELDAHGVYELSGGELEPMGVSLGDVDPTKLRLFKGGVVVEGRRSLTHTLYDEAVATFEADEVYDQADSAGFIRLNALRLRTLGGKRISEGE